MKSFLILFSALIIVFLGVLFFIMSKDDAPTAKLPPVDLTTTNTQTSSTQDQFAYSTPTDQQLATTATSMVQSSTTTEKTIMQKDTYTVTLKTNQGDIVLELYASKVPNTVQNFVKLAQSGFYNNVKFHRVIKGFMIQGGDPNTKDDNAQNTWGMGGPGYKFADEFAKGLSNVPGTISMANSGPNTNGSQFFINTANNSFLDGKHSVFGKVVKGLDVVQKIESSKTDAADRPVEPVVILSASVE